MNSWKRHGGLTFKHCCRFLDFILPSAWATFSWLAARVGWLACLLGRERVRRCTAARAMSWFSTSTSLLLLNLTSFSKSQSSKAGALRDLASSWSNS